MSTYYIYVRNKETRYKWYCIGTARHYNDEQMQNEIFAMQDRNPDSEYKWEKR